MNHQDTTNLPFSYLIEQQSTSYIMPAANLKSVGTIRDAKKWPSRDVRRDPDKLDCINFNLLSPFTIQKMINGREILRNLQKVSGVSSDTYSYQSGKIKNSSLKKGLNYYSLAIDKFLGNSLISRLMKMEFYSVAQMHQVLAPTASYGEGEWLDLSGLIAPKKAVDELLDAIERGTLKDIAALGRCFADIHWEYYDYEWTWAYKAIEEIYGVSLYDADPEKLAELICRWRNSVVSLDNLIYEDARKEFELSSMSDFDSDPFVQSVREHIKVKTELADTILSKLRTLS